MKKILVPLFALLLAGGAQAAGTLNHVVRFSSWTLLGTGATQDDGNTVAIGTTPVAGSSLTVMGVVWIGTASATTVTGSYGTTLTIGSLTNLPGLIFQGPSKRWGIRAGSSNLDFQDETLGATLGTLTTSGNWSVTSLTAQSLAPNAVGTDLNLATPASASDVVTGAVILKPGTNGAGVGMTGSITITGAHVVGAGVIQGSSVTIMGGGVNIPSTTIGGDVNISGGAGRDASGGSLIFTSGAATHSSGASGNIRLDIAAGAGSTGQTIFRVNGSTVAIVDASGVLVSDGLQFLTPRAASIRGTLTPKQEGAQVWDSVAHAVCSATGTVSTSWIAGVTGSTPCAH